MGKLGDLIKEYKLCPINSPKEKDIKDQINQIVDSEWWKSTVGTEFKWPVKVKNTYQTQWVMDMLLQSLLELVIL